MRNFKLTIEYDGTQFHGWQIQKQGERTVQGEIQDALSHIFQKNIKLIGSGRTDSGVHALGQVAHVKVATRMSAEQILKAVNTQVGRDIVVHNVQEVDVDFHAQYSAKEKTYRYSIMNNKLPLAIGRQYAIHHPYKLNVSRMRSEAKCLLGKHDFKSFQASDEARSEKDTVRVIKNIMIKKQGCQITIDITANGFLYKMVRNIVGTLLEIGSSHLEVGSLQSILIAKKRCVAGHTAPAHGLCLVKVEY